MNGRGNSNRQQSYLPWSWANYHFVRVGLGERGQVAFAARAQPPVLELSGCLASLNLAAVGIGMGNRPTLERG